MPEGPSIVIVKEAIAGFNRKKVIAATGNAKIDMKIFEGQPIRDIKTWGKHLLICFPSFTARIHFLMFGTYLIDERKTTPLRLSLRFDNGELNFYTCAVKIIEEPLDERYDWSADVMSDEWSSRKAAAKLKKLPDTMVCDALMDQEIFSGVGNIIKNEVLFRIKVHPASAVSSLPPAKRSALIRESRVYSFEFLEWRKAFTLKKHWLIYHKKKCPRDGSVVKKEELGVRKRASFFCDTCQLLYKKVTPPKKKSASSRNTSSSKRR